MTLLSLAIDHTLRPAYQRIGRSVGEMVADAVGAEGDQRQKIINTSTMAASVGLSLGCACLTANAVGFIHAAAAAADTADAVDAATTVPAPAWHPSHACHALHFGDSSVVIGHTPGSFPEPVHQGPPGPYVGNFDPVVPVEPLGGIDGGATYERP